MGAIMTTSRFGGELISFKLDGIEKIHQGEESVDENGKPYWKRHAPVLFPIVGKLKRSQTLINGRTYEMPQHGFARDMEYEPITKLDNFHSYVLKSNKYTMARYPFEFELYNTYRQEDNKLIFMYKVVNTGQNNMPFCLGGHPAFKIDPDDLRKGNYFLEFEEEEEKAHFLYLVDGLVGTEYSKNLLINNKYLLLEEHTFDNDALIIKGIQNKRISLKNRRTKKKVLTLNYEGWTYLGIWSKAGAPFLCLEPWTSTADRVNSNNVFVQKTDLKILEPGDEFDNKFSVEFFN
ncbi:MAG: aldose 1-epimerase family protein [Clostridia bacterium]|nr:aldose 1-epimerase family protein [Clostridia bacterium]